MSFITILVKKEGKLLVGRSHYRNVIELMNNRFHKLSFSSRKQIDDFDAGFIFIDMDSRKILSCQSGFGLHNLKKDAQKFFENEFEFVDFYG